MTLAAAGWDRVLHRQGFHLAAYVGLGALLSAAVGAFPERHGVVWGLSATQWIALSWGMAGLHQGWVALFWRLELYRGSIGASFGRAGFRIFEAGFAAFALTRLLALVPISMATAGTLPIPRGVALALVAVTTPFILWTFYSFVVHLGLDRALGADHFDPAYRSGSLETRGIFRHLRNPAYAVGLLILYHAGLLWMSRVGLVAAAAHHALVWCHYLCTEKPDMREIYG